MNNIPGTHAKLVEDIANDTRTTTEPLKSYEDDNSVCSMETIKSAFDQMKQVSIGKSMWMEHAFYKPINYTCNISFDLGTPMVDEDADCIWIS